MTPILVTLDSLVEVGACQEEVDIFGETFGEQIEVTLDALFEAADANLDIEWWFYAFFPTLESQFDEETAPLFTEREGRLGALWREHESGAQALRDEFDRSLKALRLKPWRRKKKQALWHSLHAGQRLLVESYRQREDALDREYLRKLALIVWELFQKNNLV